MLCPCGPECLEPPIEAICIWDYPTPTNGEYRLINRRWPDHAWVATELAMTREGALSVVGDYLVFGFTNAWAVYEWIDNDVEIGVSLCQRIASYREPEPPIMRPPPKTI